jgi:small subunit ribosomal protein S17
MQERTENTLAVRGRRKVRTGVVVSDKMDKTVVVRIDRKTLHPVYKKTVQRSSRFAVHDENNDAHVGDLVRVMETRPLSKTKRWRVVEVIERAK